MSQLRTTAVKREIMTWSPYVRLVHDYSEIGRQGLKVNAARQINDHALHYFRNGTGEYSLGGKSYRIEPGSVFIVRPEQGYSFILETKPCPHMLNIHFDLVEQDDSFQPYPYPCKARHDSPLRLPKDIPDKVNITNRKSYENIFFELYSIFLLQGKKWEIKKKSLMLDLLGIIYDNTITSSPGVLQEHRAVVQASREYIYNNLKRKVTLTELVRHARVCRALFVRIFKEECGLSPIKFINKVKIEKAKNELISSNIPIKEVAESLGFADVYHFSRIFKEFTGMPPGKYKNDIFRLIDK